MKTLCILLALVLGYAGMFPIGYYAGRESVEPQQVIEREVHIEFIPVELREFEDEAEMVKFLNERDRTVRFVSPAILNDYDNFAQDLVKQARALGYDVWLQGVDGCWMCMTIIGEDVYLIDASLNEYWR